MNKSTESKKSFEVRKSGCRSLEVTMRASELKRINGEIGHILKGKNEFDRNLTARLRMNKIEGENELKIDWYAVGVSFAGVASQTLISEEIQKYDCELDCFFVVSSVSFFKLVDSLGDSAVKLVVTENELVVKQDKRKSSLPRLDSEKIELSLFPIDFESKEIRHSAVLDQTVLLEGLRSVSFARSVGMSRPNLELVEIEIADKKLLFSASDGYRASRFTNSYSESSWRRDCFNEKDLGSKFQLTTELLSTISKVFKKNCGLIRIYNLTKFCVLCVGNAKYFSAYLDLPFPNLDSVIPKDDPDILFTTTPEFLLGKLEAFNAIPKSEVLFDVSKEYIVCLSSEDTEGKIKITDEFGVSGEFINKIPKFKINLSYLKQALGTFNPSSEIIISMSSSVVMIRYSTFEDYHKILHLIMPIML